MRTMRLFNTVEDEEICHMDDIKPEKGTTNFFTSDRFYYSSFATNTKRNKVFFFGRAYSFRLDLENDDPMNF